ncbi:uncharacterized protein LOC135029485 [Pseudophryne corroboree]|uniref:uncharacterized protein LOC135029485 n=1 Tax=Pseudophryne corroboree TaxID=495146 RepID=UPI003081EA85
MDPRGGQCRARNVNTREVSLHAGHVGSPARQHLSNDREKSSYDARISSPKITQILLPNTRASEHSRSHLYHSGPDSGSELPSRRPGQQLHLPGSSVLYHGIIPMSGPQPTNRRGDVWLVGAGPSLSQDPEERPLQDSAPLDSVHKSSNETQQIRDRKLRECPAGWTLHQKHCYYHNTLQKSTWEGAEHDCAQRSNSHLTSVHSEADMSWLWKFAGKKPFWIGQCRARNVNTREVSLHAGHVGSPARQHLSNDREKSSYDAGISSPKITQILLPNTRASEHSRSHLYHYGPDSGSELPSRRPGQQLHLPGSSVLVRSFNFLKRKKGRKKKALITLGINEKYHGIIPMSGPQPTNRRGDVWLVGAGPSLSQDPEERPLQDSAPLDSVHKSSNETQQDRKLRECPAGWTLHQKHCYYHNTLQKSTWEGAEHDCAQRSNSHLTSVHSEADMSWLWKFAGKKPFWIGVTVISN